MEARVCLQRVGPPAKDLPDVGTAFGYEYLHEVLMDPSRSNSSIVIQFAKPIPLAQLYDKASTALEDSIKEKMMTFYQ